MSDYQDYPDDAGLEDDEFLHDDTAAKDEIDELDDVVDDVEVTLAEPEVEFNEILDDFIRLHNLDDESLTLLYATHPEVQQEVLEKFVVADERQESSRNRIFQSFCRSRAMKFFTRQWKLNSPASDLLFHAPPDVQITLMGSFDPPNPDVDVNRLFMAFATKTIRSQGRRGFRGSHVSGIGAPCAESRGEAHPPPNIAAFCRKWELDDVSREAMENVPPEVAGKIMKDFAPKKLDPVTVNAKFLGFIKSRVPPSLTRTSDCDDNISSFVRNWDLPQEAATALEVLPLGIRASVMAEFNPKPETENMTNNFLSFVESRKKQTTSHFIRRFDLDAQSQRVLNELDSCVRQEVMDNFAPREVRERDSGNMNPLFMAYAASIQRSQRKPGRVMGAPIERGSSIVDRPRGVTKSATAEVEKFCAKFRLDYECQDRLARLPADVRAVVMAEFEPRERSNLRTLFLKFLRSREMTMGGASPRMSRGVESFCSKWKLDEKCQRKLSGLSLELQAVVMKEFGPKDTSHDASPLFMSFVRSRENSAETSAPPRSGTRAPRSVETFCSKWGLDDECLRRMAELSPDMQRCIMDEFDPKTRASSIPASPLFMSFVRSREKLPVRNISPRRPVRTRERSRPRRVGTRISHEQLRAIGKFVQKHRLDSHCAKSLEDLKIDDQNLAMAHFDPSRREDASTQFVKFLRTRNLKRPRDAGKRSERRVKPRR